MLVLIISAKVWYPTQKNHSDEGWSLGYTFKGNNSDITLTQHKGWSIWYTSRQITLITIKEDHSDLIICATSSVGDITWGRFFSPEKKCLPFRSSPWRWRGWVSINFPFFPSLKWCPRGGSTPVNKVTEHSQFLYPTPPLPPHTH